MDSPSVFSTRFLSAVEGFNRDKPNKTVVDFEADYYPDEVRQVLVEFGVLVNGDFVVTYREVRERMNDVIAALQQELELGDDAPSDRVTDT